MNEVERALRQLVDKLNEIHRHPQFMAMWFDAHRGGRYAGPGYGPELDAAVAALASSAHEENSIVERNRLHELEALRCIYEAACQIVQFDGVDKAITSEAIDELFSGVERVKRIDARRRGDFPPLPFPSDAQILAVRDEHLPSQGEPFDCLAFARAVLAIRR